MKLCVMGLGYIGLPTAVIFAQSGMKVHGVDVNEKVVNTLNSKQLHIKEPGLKEKMLEVMENGNLTVSAVPINADVYILAVPTPITSEKKADLSYVENAAKMILPYIRKGNLVILESTVPPGTVENSLVPILEESGLQIGKELLVSHSPERVIPGRLFEELIYNDRIIGGINEESSLKSVLLYKRFVKGNIFITDARTAEAVKLIENTYRDVNIALANEFATIGEKLGINMWEAITLANYHPRVNIHSPGPGVGGHCIAVDPYFIVQHAPQESKMISLARKINEQTPYKIVKLIEQVVSDIEDPTITLLGLAYKGNIDDLRESPSLVIYSELKKKGFKIKLHDPLVSYPGILDSIEEAVKATDCIVVLTDHNEYKNFHFENLLAFLNSRNIIDTKNILNHYSLRLNGFNSILIGTPLS